MSEPKQSEAAQHFLSRVVEIGKEMGLSISHEDDYGAFIVEPYSKDREEWILEASDKTPEGERLRQQWIESMGTHIPDSSERKSLNDA